MVNDVSRYFGSRHNILQLALKEKRKKIWEVPLERVTFFRLHVYERVGFSLVEVLERVGKTFNAVCERSQKG